jgi:hypothetical protein
MSVIREKLIKGLERKRERRRRRLECDGAGGQASKQAGRRAARQEGATENQSSASPSGLLPLFSLFLILSLLHALIPIYTSRMLQPLLRKVLSMSLRLNDFSSARSLAT